MRATEFITEEAKAAKYNGLLLKFAFNDRALIMKAFEPATKNPIAYVKFVKENEELYPQDLWVNDDYRNKGIAKSMYDYLKDEGFIINRSHDQTKAGSGFWDKHRGEDAYVWEDAAPETLYHVTPTRNVKSILAKGLVPSIGARSSQLETESNLFFFPSKDAAEDALMNWLGDEFPEDEPLALLAVSSNGLEGKFTQGAEYEYTVSSPVPPQNIKVVSTNI
jgi:hypothetical protein